MIPPEIALSPIAELLQSLQVSKVVSLAHPLKNVWKIFDERVKVMRVLWRICQKSSF